jgi:hypothetical protein
MRNAIGYAVMAGLLATAAPAQASELWGLVIGIDDYQNVNKLDGAVNDAVDIQHSIEKLGAKQVILLKNAEANRATILAKWQELAAKAGDGDTLIVSFAGHGGEVPDEAGQPHRFVALANFKFDSTAEMLFDADFGALLRAEKRLTVIFAVDACHSGTMTRGYKATPVKVRSIGEVGRSAPVETLMRSLDLKGNEGAVQGTVLPNVVHLGAVRTDELVPEVSIDGQKRGALSYAFARALEGAADADHDGVISNAELTNYLTSVITQRSDGQQHPVLAVPAQWNLPLVRGMSVNKHPAHIAIQPVPLSIANSGAFEAGTIAKDLQNLALTPKDQAALNWDVGAGQITNALGDLVATVPVPTRGFTRVVDAAGSSGTLESSLLGDVQHVIDKTALVTAIKADSAAHPLLVSLSPDDKVHTKGAQVSFQISPGTYTNLTLFDLASDGTVQFLYPLNTKDHKDPLQIDGTRPYALPLTVAPPFGADHLVAILSAEPLTSLHGLLVEADGKPSAQLAAKLGDVLDGKNYQIGIYPSFTAEK